MITEATSLELLFRIAQGDLVGFDLQLTAIAAFRIHMARVERILIA